jgi:tetratricopeptide (TPR) repeat protein
MTSGSASHHGVSPAVLVGAIAALSVAVTMQMIRDRAYPAESVRAERYMYVQSPQAIGRMALAFDAVAADVYWIRAIQHYGGDRLTRSITDTRYELLYPLLDITTTLDPYFNIAYRFGAIFLSEPYPGGAGRPDLAIALLRKGIAARPTKWEYYHDIAFIHYWSLGDYKAAADWFHRGAMQPNAPEWLLPVAASMLAEGKNRTAARTIWTELLRADEDWVSKRAARALVQLDTMDWIDKIAAQIAKAPPLKEPFSWSALARAGVLAGVPVDHAGTPLEIDPITGAISVARTSPLFPMPRGLRR